jgi:hypothetical protein
VFGDGLKKELEFAWRGAVENTGIRGKFKQALTSAFMTADVNDVLESLWDAPLQTKHEWRRFYERWADAEVRRIFADLTQFETFMHKTAWEKTRDERRRQSKHRTTVLQREIFVYARDAGGTINYAPAFVARVLAEGRKSLKPTTVEKAMRDMCRRGVARKVSTRKGTPAHFTLLTSRNGPRLTTDRTNSVFHQLVQ